MDLLYGTVNISFFDSYWALVHFMSGLVLGILFIKLKFLETRKYFISGIFILFVWEVFEAFLRIVDVYSLDISNIIRSIVPSAYFATESPINILSDLILGTLGLLIVFSFRSKIIKHEK